MRGIEAAIYIWLVLGAGVQAHKVHKRILVSPMSLQISNFTADNQTTTADSGDGAEPTAITEQGAINATDSGSGLIPVSESPNENPPPTGPLELGIEHAGNLPIDVHLIQGEGPLIGNDTTPVPRNIESKSSAQNQTYLVSVVFVPSIIPSESLESHAEKTETETPEVAMDAKSEVKEVPNHLTEALDIDLPRLLNPRPSYQKKSTKFENATTSVLSEIESEMGVLLEISTGVDAKHNASLHAKNTTAAEHSTPHSQSNKLEVPKPGPSADETPFFEDFSPFFPLETFFGSLLMPQETIIIETDSELPSPPNFFSSSRELFLVPNSPQSSKQLPTVPAKA